MIIIPKYSVDIVESNIAEIEDGIDVWSEGSYSKGDIVQKGENIFKSLADNNTATPVAETTTTGWSYKGKTNYKRMFDPKRSSKTTNINRIYYKFNVSDVDTIAFFALKAETLQIVLKDAKGVVAYDSGAIALSYRVVRDWLEWGVAPFIYKKKYYYNNLPLIYQATLEITLTGENVECGHCVFGRSIKTGALLIDPKPVSSIRSNVSEKIVDGVVVIENDLIRRRVNLNIEIDTGQVDMLIETLEDYSSTALLFVGDSRDGGHTALMGYGYFKDIDMPVGLVKTFYEIEYLGVA